MPQPALDPVLRTGGNVSLSRCCPCRPTETGPGPRHSSRNTRASFQKTRSHSLLPFAASSTDVRPERAAPGGSSDHRRSLGYRSFVDFRVLGVLEVLDDAGRPVDVRGTKLRSLLAALLLRAGHPVSADALAEAVWGDNLPGGVDNALQAQMSKLRKTLPGVALRTQGRSYVLEVEPARIDARRF